MVLTSKRELARLMDLPGDHGLVQILWDALPRISPKKVARRQSSLTNARGKAL